MPDRPRATLAVSLFERHLAALPHPGGLVRLVQFTHSSPGLQKLKRQISEALVLLLETNGFHLCNGLSEAQALLQAHGYQVLGPVPNEALAAAPEALESALAEDPTE